MTPEIINPNLQYNGIQEGNFLDQATMNGMFNKITNFLHGLYTKASAHASVLTSLLVNVKKLADESKRQDEAITMLQDFNPVGCVIQTVHELNEIQLKYYRECNGDKFPFDKDAEGGVYKDIHKILYVLGNNNSEEGYENHNGEVYLPNMQGMFLVGAGVQTLNGVELTRKTIGSIDGKETNTLDMEHIPPHTHYISTDNDASGDNDRIAVGNSDDANGSWLKGDSMRMSGKNSDGEVVDLKSDRIQSSFTNMPPYYVVKYWIRVRK
jgi:microcystin-dependent protein